MEKKTVEITEELLVRKAQIGDVAAFKELLLRYEGKIYNLALRIMGNKEDANDVLQETFITAFKKLSTFKGESSFYTWIYRIATNICFMKKRGMSKKKTVSLDLPILTQHDEIKRELPDDWSKSPSATLENKELKDILSNAINELPEDYKTVLVLRDMEGLSNDDVSNIMKISIPAVKSRLHRARFFVRDALSKYFNSEDVKN